MNAFRLIVRLLHMLLHFRRSGNSQQLLSEIELDESPRSLNGCDQMLLPQILADFPDFDAVLAKTYARDYLTDKLGSHSGLVIHNVVISRYHRSRSQKAIVFQAAVCWTEGGKKAQKRFDLNYTYLLSGSDTIAANCPNCGGVLNYGMSECAYCGSWVANAMKNTWTFTEMKET